jgi:hypothetical protein
MQKLNNACRFIPLLNFRCLDFRFYTLWLRYITLTSSFRWEFKGKGHPTTGHQGPRGGSRGVAYSFSSSALEGGGWLSPRTGRFSPGKDPVPIVQEAGCVPGPVWTCAKNLAPTGIRSPDRPVVSRYTD